MSSTYIDMPTALAIKPDIAAVKYVEVGSLNGPRGIKSHLMFTDKTRQNDVYYKHTGKDNPSFDVGKIVFWELLDTTKRGKFSKKNETLRRQFIQTHVGTHFRTNKKQERRSKKRKINSNNREALVTATCQQNNIIIEDTSSSSPTHVKAIDVWPDEGSESVEEEAEEEEEDSSEEENTADDSSIEENDDEEQLLITPNSTPSGKNSLSTTCKQTQVMDLNHDSETTILNGMTIIASSSSSSIGSRASSSNSSTTTTKTTTRTTTSSTPKINQKEIKRHKNKIQLKYSNKKEALTLFSKEIMEFKSLLDNKAISEATYKEWVAKAKANYDTVHTIESQT